MKSLPHDIDYIVRRLQGIRMFQNLDADEVRTMATMCSLASYDDAETIVTQNSSSSTLFVIIEGKVDIFVAGKDKDEVFISRVKDGDVFGEASIFMDVQRTATARADGSVILASVTRDSFARFANENPRAGLKILTFIIYSLLNKLALANKDLALEKESQVTADDIEELRKLFPKTIGEIGGDARAR